MTKRLVRVPNKACFSITQPADYEYLAEAGTTEGETVFVQDPEFQYLNLLGPGGEALALIEEKEPVGFRLVAKA